MKRITAFMLGIILAFSSFNLVIAAKAEDTVKVERALGILKAIGRFSDYDMSTVETDKEISRGEFSQCFAELLMLTASEEKLFYHDVSKEYYAYDGITALTEAGFTSGYGNNIFKPEQIMTRSEAAIVITSALGYKTEAIARGGNVADYMQIANELELFDGTESKQSLTFSNMLIMFVNALLAPVSEVTYTGSSTKYEKSDECLLSLYYDCHYSEKERVTFANNTGIYTEKQPKDMVVIGNRSYIPISKNMEQYLGSYVNFIYKGEYDEEDCQIIWIEKNGQYGELVLQEDDIEGFNPENYTYRYYTENGRIKTISLNKNISVIYNGCFEKDIEKFLSLPCSEIRFVENQKGEYDTVIISDYVNYVIDSVYITDEVMTVRQTNERINIAEDDYENFLVLDENLNVISVDDLTSDSTVSIFESADGKYLKLIVSQKTAEGVIETVSHTSDKSAEMKLSGQEYKLSAGIDTSELSIGKNVFVYLDYNNKISYVKKDYGYGYLAYIVRITLEEGINTVKIKAFNQDGEMKLYDTATKFSVDSRLYKDVNDTNFDDLVTSAEGQLVMLEFDGEQRIKSIDIPDGNGELEISAPFANCNYRGVSPKIGKLICIDSSTKIFSIPDEPKTADVAEFKVRKKGELGDWRTFYAQAYKYTDDTDYADAVLVQGFNWNASTDTSVAFVFEKSYKTVNDENEVTTILTGIEGSEEKEYVCDADYEPTGLSAGAVFFLDLNGKNEICGMEPVFNRNSTGGESNTNLVASRRMVVGYVNKVKGNIISIGYTSPEQIDERFDCTGTPVIVVDESNRKDCVTFGSVADIMSYDESAPDEYTKIGVQTIQMSQKMIVVYK